ncbi:MAG: Flp pilus assembly complex ATPase component TadA [Clostridia bacterium]|nr:Flp pilus assembly complex ATPase component TadA [Clostridia bacterium]
MENISEYFKNHFDSALSYLPLSLADAVRKVSQSGADEIRLINGAECIVSSGGACIRTGAVCSDEDIRYIIKRVSGNSLYAYTDTINDGYISTSEGLRVGVAGRAVCSGGKIVSVTDISSVIIRIPSRRPGAADTLFSLMKSSGFSKNVLIFSPPAGGKTTMLRELVYKLSENEKTLRIAVVDTRCEICEGIEKLPVVKLLSYPRDIGIEVAVRTMSPDIIICDEVYGESDFSSLDAACGSGITSVVSVHASSVPEVRSKLERARCRVPFGIIYGINRSGDPDVYTDEPSEASL